MTCSRCRFVCFVYLCDSLSCRWESGDQADGRSSVRLTLQLSIRHLDHPVGHLGHDTSHRVRLIHTLTLSIHFLGSFRASGSWALRRESSVTDILSQFSRHVKPQPSSDPLCSRSPTADASPTLSASAHLICLGIYPPLQVPSKFATFILCLQLRVFSTYPYKGKKKHQTSESESTKCTYWTNIITHNRIIFSLKSLTAWVSADPWTLWLWL